VVEWSALGSPGLRDALFELQHWLFHRPVGSGGNRELDWPKQALLAAIGPLTLRFSAS
jgi:hypothetical protein